MSIYTEIFAGRAPGRFVWEDEICVAFATIEPVALGHVLVVPRLKINKYSDLPPQIFSHLVQIAQIIGKAQESAFQVERTLFSIMGFAIPHVHLHVVPAKAPIEKNMHKAQYVSYAELEKNMEKIRQVLLKQGYREFVPAAVDKLSGKFPA